MFKIEEYSEKIKNIEERIKQKFINANIEYNIEEEKKNTIKLVFTGQYSAGKSSIIRMLTGREDITVGAGITTQKAHIYEWNGLEIVDTPGIHTQLRPDHDEISYDAIASADMLVFVVTNELFDSHLAQHFRKLAIDKDKAGEMILVVNKMERSSEGNTLVQQSVIREDLRKVIEPYTPEELNLCFLDAESYLDSLEERDEDIELADELFSRSGYTDFIETLNYFVKKKSLALKLTTKLYKMDDGLQKAIQLLEPKSSDNDIDALEENFIQQRYVLSESRNRLQEEISGIFTSSVSKIRDLGVSSADLLVEGCKKEDIESEFEKSICYANETIEKCQQEAIEKLEVRLNEIGQEIDSIENSKFSKELKLRLDGKFDGLPDNIKRILVKAGNEAQKNGNKVMKNAYKLGSKGGMKLTNFSGSSIHNIVIKAGHSIGYKFKPWQAIKITKGVAIAGQALAIFGVGLSVFMQIKSDKDEEKIREDLRKNRQNIRSQFNSAASELEDYGRKFIRENIYNSLDNSIQEIDNNIREIRKTRSNRSILCNEMENLQVECRALIKEIHNM